MKILLAVDPPEAGSAGIEALLNRPWPPHSTVEVLSVVETARVWDVPSLVDGLREAGADAIRSASDRLRPGGFEVSSCLLMGDPKDLIVDRARDIHADLVMLGSRHIAGLSRFLLGSVAAAVARFAPCSVEIVRPAAGGEPGTNLKVLVATDGSECSRLAIRSIAERPWPQGTEFQVVSAMEMHAPLVGLPYFRPSAMEQLRADAARRAEEAEMAAERVLTDAGLKTSGTVLVPTAPAKELILQKAEEWGAGLIVCGSHGHRGWSRFFLGSVSEAIASHAHCSVEIIRPAQP